MRKHVVCLLAAGLVMMLTPACTRAQSTMIQPVDFTGPLSHPGYDLGGWYLGLDFLFLHSLAANGTSGNTPDSILSVGYRTEEGTVYQFSWWDQWLSPNPNPASHLEILDFSARVKTYDNGCFRSFAVFGIRGILTNEAYDFAGGLNYNIDNNMVGVFVGSMNEWYLGTNPLGTFSWTLDLEAGAYADFVRQAAGSPAGVATLETFTLAASLQGKTGFIWYVWEGITFHAGFDLLAILNQQTAHQPVAPAGGAIDARLVGSVPVYFGVYLGFGFVF